MSTAFEGIKRGLEEAIEHAEGRVPGVRIHRPHDEAVVELLREDPAFAAEYLAASLEAIDEPGGQEALQQALRHVAEAQGMNRKQVLSAVRALTHDHDYVWDGKDEDDRPATEEELRTGIEAARRGRPAGTGAKE